MSPLDLLQSETKRRLLELMKRRGEITLDDAMAVIDRARPTLRDHLNQMGRDGLVARRTKKQGRGRPSMCYRMTSFAERLFPGREGPVFADFLSFIQEQGHEPLIEEFFESSSCGAVRKTWRNDGGPPQPRAAEPPMRLRQLCLRLKHRQLVGTRRISAGDVTRPLHAFEQGLVETGLRGAGQVCGVDDLRKRTVALLDNNAFRLHVDLRHKSLLSKDLLEGLHDLVHACRFQGHREAPLHLVQTRLPEGLEKFLNEGLVTLLLDKG